MPPPAYPAQVSAAVDCSSVKIPSLSARAALDAYPANPHLRSSATFEFLHFAVIGTHKVRKESCVDDTGVDHYDFHASDVDDAMPFIDVSMLELDGIEEHAHEVFEDEDEHGGDPKMFNQGWMVIDVDLEDANGTMLTLTLTLTLPQTLTLTLSRRDLPRAHPVQ